MEISLFYMGIEPEWLRINLEYFIWASMPILSQYNSYYWTSIPIISQTIPYYWTPRWSGVWTYTFGYLKLYFCIFEFLLYPTALGYYLSLWVIDWRFLASNWVSELIEEIFGLRRRVPQVIQGICNLTWHHMYNRHPNGDRSAGFFNRF